MSPHHPDEEFSLETAPLRGPMGRPFPFHFLVDLVAPALLGGAGLLFLLMADLRATVGVVAAEPTLFLLALTLASLGVVVHARTLHVVL